MLFSVVSLGIIFSAIYWFTMNDACVHYDELLMYSAENPVKQSICNQDGVANVGMGILLLLAAALYTVTLEVILRLAGYKLTREKPKD